MMSIKSFNQIKNELQKVFKLSWADATLIIEMILEYDKTWLDEDELRLRCIQFAQRLENS